MTGVVVPVERLHSFYRAVFGALGLSPEHARVCADGLAHADLAGIPTHGAASLDRLYVRMLRDGLVDATAVPHLLHDRGAVALVDGGNAVGFVAAEFATRQAMDRASRYGVGAVAVRNSSHCGAMGHYSALAAQAGMVGVAMTNLGAQALVLPPDGAGPLLGTNAVAAAAPTGQMPLFNLDMSTAVAAAGRVRLARDRGEPVPAGWLADASGATVTDPDAYFADRAWLRFLGGAPETGGYKGFGLAMLIDVLCGTLAGAGVGPDAADGHVRSRADADIGHFVLVLEVGAFRDTGDFRADLDRMLATVCASTPADPARPVRYPGLPEHEHREGALADGVALRAGVVAGFERMVAELGVPGPWEPGRKEVADDGRR